MVEAQLAGRDLGGSTLEEQAQILLDILTVQTSSKKMRKETSCRVLEVAERPVINPLVAGLWSDSAASWRMFLCELEAVAIC